jgi:hypothetical protein
MLMNVNKSLNRHQCTRVVKGACSVDEWEQGGEPSSVNKSTDGFLSAHKFEQVSNTLQRTTVVMRLIVSIEMNKSRNNHHWEKE